MFSFLSFVNCLLFQGDRGSGGRRDSRYVQCICLCFSSIDVLSRNMALKDGHALKDGP